MTTLRMRIATLPLLAGLFLTGCEPREPYAPTRAPIKQESTEEKKDSGVKIDVDVPDQKGDVKVDIEKPPDKPN